MAYLPKSVLLSSYPGQSWGAEIHKYVEIREAFTMDSLYCYVCENTVSS